MRKVRFAEHQIITLIKSVEVGLTIKVVCLEAGVSEATYYNCKSRYGCMKGSDIRTLKDLEGENRPLKLMSTDLSQENCVLLSVIENNFQAGL